MSVPSETLDGMDIETVPSLVSLALALGAEDAGDLSAAEKWLVDEAHGARTTAALVRGVRGMIRRGEDPLGDAYCTIRSPEERRPLGQT